MLRIVVIDDHPVVSTGLAHTLPEVDPGIKIIASATSAKEGLELVERLQPDVVMLDLYLPGASGLDILQALADGGPKTVVYTVSEDPRDAAAALEAGALGYLCKSITLEDLALALRTVASGRTVISPAVSTALLRTPAARELVIDGDDRRLLGLIASGAADEDIAAKLNVSVATTKRRIKGLVEKLGVSNRTQAAVWAAKNKVI